MGVPELHKEAGESCTKLAESSCSSYGQRPRSCRDFDCLWLQGVGPTEARPDLSGLVLTVTVQDGVLGKAGSVIVAHEATLGSSDTREATALLQSLVPVASAIIIVRPNGTRAVLSNNPVVLRRAQNLARGIA